MRKLIIFLFLIFIPVRVSALSAKSAVLIDTDSGRVLYEHNSYEKLPMASTTKIMTGLLACESGKLDETVKVSPFASGTEGSSLWLKPGEKLSLEELIYGLMLKSGNDSAVAIAEYLGGNIDAFALLMNEKAREIGAVNTSFKNPHGLNAEGHYTTAYDLALIAREAMKNDTFRKIVSTKTYSIPMEGENWDRALKNHNKLLWRYEGCNGIKTGFTKKSGRCLVSSVTKGEQNFICVTLNAPDDWNDHIYILDYCLKKYKTKLIAKKGEKVCDYIYNKKFNKSVSLAFGENYKIALDEADVLTTEIKYNKINLPAKKGTVAGYMEIFCNGDKVGEVKLITTKNIKKISFLEKFSYGINKFIK